jgi:hypothetical protein
MSNNAALSDNGQKSRFAIDIDELERQLRSSPAQEVKQPSADPLAELARLVGQDDPFRQPDPFKDMFATGPGDRMSQPAPANQSYSPQSYSPGADMGSTDGQRVEPSFGQYSQPPAGTHQGLPENGVRDDLRGALDEFDAIFDKPRAAAPVNVAGQPSYHPAAPVYHEPGAHEDMIARDLDKILEEGRHVDGHSSTGLSAGMMAGAATGAVAGMGAASAQPYTAQYDDAPATEDMAPQGRRFGKGAVTAAVLVAIGLGGVGAAALWRGGGKSASGEPPVIQADRGPSKVAPQNPGGAEIPDQNKQIYERNAASKPADAKVVNREEQPIDVQAATRAAARVIAPGGSVLSGTDTTTAAVAPNPTAALGEPKKVRTISIRPDGSVVGSAPAPAAAAPAPVAPRIATAAAPPIQASTPAASTPSSTASTTSSSPIVRQQAPKPAVPVRAAPADTADAPLNLAPQAAPARPKPQERVAVAAAPAPERPAAAGSGNFTVQLGAPGSEEEARSSFASLQRRYPDELGDQRPIIRKAEVGGKSVYRLRVGSLSRDEAVDLCNRLKGRGGQCFIAAN